MSKATNNAAELRRQITNVAKETERLQKELNRISAAEFPAAKAERFERGIQKSTEKVETLRKKLEEISGRKVETTEFQKISTDLDAALEKIDKFYAEAQEKISGLGLPDDTDPASVMSAKARADFEAACRTADELQEKYNAMRADGSRYQNMTETKEYKNTASQLAEAEQNLANETNAYNQAKADFQATQQESFQNTEADLNESLEKLGEMRSELQSVESSGQAFQRMGQIAKSAMSGVKQAVSTAVNGIKKLAGHVADATKKLGALAAAGVKNISGIGKHSKSSSNMVEQLGKRIWGLAKRVFVFSMITKGLRAIRSAFGEGLGYYSAWDRTLGASIQNLKNQVLVLKASLGGAFAPITQIVVPILSTLVGWLITATNAVGAFIARLTGKSTYKSVVAATAQAGAEAAKSVGGATDAVKELKKELAHYDELHVISNDDASGGGGGGGAGGGGGTSGPGIEYQDTKISDGISDFADKVKEAWRKADFTEIGTILGTKLKEGLDNIPWASIQEKARNVGKSFSTLINGFVEVKGLGYSIGQTIGQALNTGLSLASGFINNLHFESIGKFIRDGINGFLDAIHWQEAYDTAKRFGSGIAELINSTFDPITSGKAGRALGNAFKVILDAITGFVSKIDGANVGRSITAFWTSFTGRMSQLYPQALATVKKAGEEIGKMLNHIITPSNLAKAGQLVGQLVSVIVKGLNSLLETADFKNWGKSVGAGVMRMVHTIPWREVGNLLGNGLQKAMDFLKGFISSLKWKDIRDALKEFFMGIAEKVDFKDVVKILGVALGLWLLKKLVFFIGASVMKNIGLSLASSIGGAAASGIKVRFPALLGPAIVAGLGLAIASKNGANLTAFGKQIANIISKGFKGEWDSIWKDFDPYEDIPALKKAKEERESWNKSYKDLVDPSSSMGGGVMAETNNGLSKMLEQLTGLKTKMKEIYEDMSGFGGSGIVNIDGSISDGSTKTVVQNGKFVEIPQSEVQKTLDNMTGLYLTVSDIKDNVPVDKKKIKDGIMSLGNVKDDLSTDKKKSTGWLAAFNKKDYKAGTSTVNGWNANFNRKNYTAGTQTILGWLANFNRKNYTGGTQTIAGWLANFNRKNYTGGTQTIAGWLANFTKRNYNAGTTSIWGWLAGFNKKDYNAGTKSIWGWLAGFSRKDYTAGSGTSYGWKAVIQKKEDGLNWWDKILYGFKAAISGRASAKGGVFSGGAWKDLPQYAAGGSPTHGTVFVAGESGAEIVGTVGGRTEVLNRSQIAMAIYSAVRSAMQGFGMEIVRQIAYDSSVISAHIDAVAGYIPDVNNITQANRAYAKTEGIDYNRLAQALQQNGGEANYTFTANLDGREIFRETVSQNDLYRTQTGRSAFA